MKKILVPIDFSDCSEYALKYAIEIAQDTKTLIHLVHVVELDYSFTGGSALGAKLSDKEEGVRPVSQIKEVFEKADQLLVDMMTPYGEEVHFTSHIIEGDLVGELISFSQTNEIDLIVLGSHGEGGKNNMLIGSNAQKVLRFSKVPVVVIKEDFENISFEKIVYTSNFKEENLNHSLPYIKSIADYYESDLHLLYINTPNKFEETDVVDARIENVIEEFDLSNATFSTFNSSWIEEGIVKFCNLADVDLLVINTHGYKGIKKLFHHSIAESVANNVKVPVMIINKS